jgi:hypothetical protein
MDTRGLETRHVLELLAENRRRQGTPHWIILDEAHLVPALAGVLGLAPGRDAGGVCAVTWRPDRPSPETLAAMDYTVRFPGLHREGAAALRDAGFPLPPPAPLAQVPLGRASPPSAILLPDTEPPDRGGGGEHGGFPSQDRTPTSTFCATMRETGTSAAGPSRSSGTMSWRSGSGVSRSA